MPTDAFQPAQRFFGATAVRAAFALAVFGWGFGFYGPPIYLAEVIARTGWSLGMVSTAVTAHFLFGAIVVANLPRAHARFGLPFTTIVGAILTAVGVLGWAVAARPWQLFGAALLSGAGWVTIGAVTVNAIVARWYAAGRPAALAKAYNGASIGGAIFSPLWVASIDTIGFARAAAALGMVMIAAVAVLCRQVFRETPEGMGQAPDGGAAIAANRKPARDERPAARKGSLWRDRAFLTLAAGMAMGLFAQTGLLAHLFNLLMPVLGSQFAGFLMGGATACAILGRFAGARAVARTRDRRIVAAASYFMQAIGVSILLLAQPGQAWMLVLGVALFGAGIGNSTSLPPLVAQTDFAEQDVQRVIALIVAVSQATYAFAPAAFGALQWMGDSSGFSPTGKDTAIFFLVAILIQAAAALTFLAGRRPSGPARRSAGRQPGGGSSPGIPDDAAASGLSGLGGASSVSGSRPQGGPPRPGP